MFNFKQIYKKWKQRGQAAVLYAVTIPVLFTFIGATFDIGWYYFNVSRLQNAADAAALAGANKIEGYANAHLVDKIEGDNVTVNDEVKNTTNKYLAYNLNESVENSISGTATTITDSWSNATVQIAPSLQQKENDLYYKVDLTTENFKHIFKIFDDMDDGKIKVRAIAKVTKPSETPLDIDKETENAMDDLKVGNVIIGNWEIQKYYYDNINNNNWKNKFATIYGTETLFNGKWNHYKTSDKKITNSGKIFREENLIVYSGSKNEYNTPANGSKKYSWTELESINIDFSQDISITLKSGVNRLTEDWDIGYPEPTEQIESIKVLNNGSKTVRTHSQFDFDEPYKTRIDKTYPDPLWVRIESEPMWYNLGVKSSQPELNTVRQIILNINASNMSEEYRPLVFFYDGPETNANNPNLTEAERASVTNPRQSQPVILNLNADFNGILYMPNSPVIINDNGYKFRGFVVAKEFRQLKNSGYARVSGSDSSTNFDYKDKNMMFVDEQGNVQHEPYSGNAKIGVYDTFGISEFTTHNYTLQKHSADNLFTSGN